MTVLNTSDIASLANLTSASLSEDAKGVSTLELAWSGFLPAWATYMEPVTLMHHGKVLFHGKVTTASNSNDGGQISSSATVSNVMWLLDHQTLSQQLAEIVAADGGDAAASMLNVKGFSLSQLANGIEISTEGWVPEHYIPAPADETETDPPAPGSGESEATDKAEQEETLITEKIEQDVLWPGSSKACVADYISISSTYLHTAPLRSVTLYLPRYLESNYERLVWKKDPWEIYSKYGCTDWFGTDVKRALYLVIEQQNSDGAWEPLGASADAHIPTKPDSRHLPEYHEQLTWHFRGINVDAGKPLRFKASYFPRLYDAPVNIGVLDTRYHSAQQYPYGIQDPQAIIEYKDGAPDPPYRPPVPSTRGTIKCDASPGLKSRYLLMRSNGGIMTSLTALMKAVENNPDAFWIVDYETATVRMTTIGETATVSWTSADAGKRAGDVRLLSCSDLAPQYENMVTGVALVLTSSGSGDNGAPDNTIQSVYKWPEDLDLTQTGVKVFQIETGSGYNPVAQWIQAAEEYYNAANALQWGGTVTAKAQDIEASPLGCRLNLLGNGTAEEWHNMQAIISGCTWDFVEGTLEVSLGRDFADPAFAEPGEADEPDEPEDVDNDTTYDDTTYRDKDDDTTDDGTTYDDDDNDSTDDGATETGSWTEPDFWTETEPTETDFWTKTESTESAPTQTGSAEPTGGETSTFPTGTPTGAEPTGTPAGTEPTATPTPTPPPTGQEPTGTPPPTSSPAPTEIPNPTGNECCPYCAQRLDEMQRKLDELETWKACVIQEITAAIDTALRNAPATMGGESSSTAHVNDNGTITVTTKWSY